MALLGMDIGGTKRVLAVGDRDGTPRTSVRLPMNPSDNWRTDMAAIIDEAKALLADTGVGPRDPLERIGVSLPGPVDSQAGRLINPPNLPNWRDAPVGPVLAEAFGVPTQIESDANAAVLAEARFGAGQGVDDLVFLTMSTGVGAGVISGGKLIRGAFGSAGEAGHIPIERGGRACACGLTGCLEAYVGGQAWQAHLRSTANPKGRVSELAGGDSAEITPKHLVQAAHEGDAFALGEMELWVERLAHGIVPIAMLLEPQRILLGTIAIAAGEALCFEPLRERLSKLLWSHQSARLEIMPGGLGDEMPIRAGLAVAQMLGDD